MFDLESGIFIAELRATEMLQVITHINMPIKHAIWTVGDKPTPLPVTRLASEQLLEDMIAAHSTRRS